MPSHKPACPYPMSESLRPAPTAGDGTQNTMYQEADFRYEDEDVQDERDARAHARNALQDAYDWRDDRGSDSPSAQRPAAPTASAGSGPGRRAERTAPQRSSVSRTAGI
jgi:hypothetical protein